MQDKKVSSLKQMNNFYVTESVYEVEYISEFGDITIIKHFINRVDAYKYAIEIAEIYPNDGQDSLIVKTIPIYVRSKSCE